MYKVFHLLWATFWLSLLGRLLICCPNAIAGTQTRIFLKVHGQIICHRKFASSSVLACVIFGMQPSTPPPSWGYLFPPPLPSSLISYLSDPRTWSLFVSRGWVTKRSEDWVHVDKEEVGGLSKGVALREEAWMMATHYTTKKRKRLVATGTEKCDSYPKE